jgi:hypothetical protein
LHLPASRILTGMYRSGRSRLSLLEKVRNEKIGTLMLQDAIQTECNFVLDLDQRIQHLLSEKHCTFRLPTVGAFLMNNNLDSFICQQA